MLKLKVFENAQSFFEKELPEQPEIKIGRAEHCDVVLRSKRVSREHCRLGFASGSWRVEDLSSQNGIRVNGEKVPSAVLKNGDNLQVGDYRLEIILPSATPVPPPSGDTDDRTILLGAPMASDETIVVGAGQLPHLSVTPESGSPLKRLLKNKTLMAFSVGALALLLILILIVGSSDSPPAPETQVTTAEQQKSEAMMDLQTQNRLDGYLKSGQDQFEAGNFNEALVRFQAALKIDPENSMAKDYFIRSREKLLEQEEQRRIAAEAEKEKMARVDQITARARQAFQQSDYSKAIEIMAEAKFLAPEAPAVTAFMREIEAAAETEKIRQQKTRQQTEEMMAQVREHFAAGQRFYDQKDYHSALREWDQVLAADLDTPETAHVRHAIPHIKSLLEADVKKDYDQGKASFQKNDYTGAVISLQKVVQVLPDYQDARKLMDAAVAELESQAKKLFQEGLVYEGIGKNAQAAAKWQEVLKIMPLETNEYYQRALKKLE